MKKPQKDHENHKKTMRSKVMARRDAIVTIHKMTRP